jgi:hypothetical protein
MSGFERNRMGGFDVFEQLMVRVSGGFCLCIVICNILCRQLLWYFDSVTIVFTFLYAVFYNFHHPLGFLKARNLLTTGAAIIV